MSVLVFEWSATLDHFINETVKKEYSLNKTYIKKFIYAQTV
jgi:hypothetical protein